MADVIPRNVPTVYGIEGQKYTMERIEGVDFTRLEPWVLSFRSQIASELFDAIAKIHEAGITHNDIQNNNIMVEYLTGRPVMLDPGYPRFESSISNASHDRDYLAYVLDDLRSFGEQYTRVPINIILGLQTGQIVDRERAISRLAELLSVDEIRLYVTAEIEGMPRPSAWAKTLEILRKEGPVDIEALVKR